MLLIYMIVKDKFLMRNIVRRLIVQLIHQKNLYYHNYSLVIMKHLTIDNHIHCTPIIDNNIHIIMRVLFEATQSAIAEVTLERK